MLCRRYTFGFDTYRRCNVLPLNGNCSSIAYVSSNAWHVSDFSTGTLVTVQNSFSGIGCIALSKNSLYIAVGYCGDNPNIVIYTLPDLTPFKTLSGGTSNRFSSLTFSQSDKYIASVGSSPDYTLTVWDWESECIMLRSKAFSQDVFNIAFSPLNDRHLVTSGIVHIKFWSMAKTFTGLKLDGKLGRFGAVELSDIYGFVQFPDGKVLCGSESGNLFLWEGALIKAVIKPNSSSNCHEGNVESLCLIYGEDSTPSVVVSAGQDGFIKAWDFDLIDQAYPEFGLEVFVTPLTSLEISNQRIHSLELLDKALLVTDTSGAVHKVLLQNNLPFDYETLFVCYSGPIIGGSWLNSSHVLCYGFDGKLIIFDCRDYCKPTTILSEQFHGNGSCLYSFAEHFSIPHLALIGTTNGIVRLVGASLGGFILFSALRPCKAAITDICVNHFDVSSTLSDVYVVTVSKDGVLWKYSLDIPNNVLTPVCMVSFSTFSINITEPPKLAAIKNGFLVTVGADFFN
ncbi:hypothetical protein P9112_011806 [Eukaryota sp. TZLM1-RC]